MLRTNPDPHVKLRKLCEFRAQGCGAVGKSGARCAIRTAKKRRGCGEKHRDQETVPGAAGVPPGFRAICGRDARGPRADALASASLFLPVTAKVAFAVGSA